jgi:hypothetical protein
MQDLPPDVREYLTAGDALGMVAVEEKYPDIRKKLRSPEIRAALLRYLASDEPWQEPNPGPIIGALRVVRETPTAAEIPLLRPLLMHPEPAVRQPVYEYMMSVYYPSQRESVHTLLQSMLLDGHDSVRAQAANYIKGLKTPEELRPFLNRWLALAAKRGWNKQESFEIVQGLVKR